MSTLPNLNSIRDLASNLAATLSYRFAPLSRMAKDLFVSRAAIAQRDALTAELEAQRRLLESRVEERTRDLADATRRAESLALIARAASDPMIVLDEGGCVIWANETHLRMSGYSPEELFGRRAETLFAGPETDFSVIADLAAAMAAGRAHRAELVQYALDGTRYVLDVSLSPTVEPQTGAMRWVAVGRDISARKELERKFELARAQAEEANKAKSAFLANMSHELRTPLNAVIGYSEILAEDLRELGLDASMEDAERIRAAARHLLALINEVLDFSKIEAGRMELNIDDIDGARLVRETLDAVALAARDGAVEISAHIDSALAHLRTDGVKLHQCVLNLLSNAVKFTKGGSVHVEAVRDGDLVRIVVEDTGIGMTAEQVSRLFQPFVQASSSTSRTFGGTGLGLAITRRLAMLLGGDVGVRSALGQGSRFELTISARFGETVSTNDPMPTGPYVLVIEDAADARDLIARAAAAMGFQTCGVSRGGDGLAHARARRPSLIVLDIGLPDGSGWTVLQTLKSDPKTNTIPVIVHSIHDDRATSIGLGACEHLVKPTERAVLASAIARFATPADEYEAIVRAPPAAISSSAAA